MRNLAIIPARGGSKRIPRKNIKDFFGKPIIAYSIELAIQSNLFDEVMVSTDDSEIAGISKQFGAIIPFMRSKNSSDDFATLSDVIEEVKAEYQKQGKKYDNICCILPTSPLLNISILEQSWKQFAKSDSDSLRPVIRFSYPIQRAMRMSEDGKVEMIAPEHLRTRSQDLEPTFHDAGQFYWMRYDCGLKGSVKMGFEISEMNAQDIDTPDDWRIAEMKYDMLRNKVQQ